LQGSCIRTFIAIFIVAVSVCSLQAQVPARTRAVDWDKLGPEILERYRGLMQLDTIAGHEILAVEYLKTVLETVWDFDNRPNRQSPITDLKFCEMARPAGIEPATLGLEGQSRMSEAAFLPAI
jgi:hypothetical protein